MKKEVQLVIQKLNKNHRYRMIWYRIVTVLACITVFITTYALILPAVTMEGASDEEIRELLYGGSKQLSCNCEVHEHTSACYDKDNNLICGYADFVVHKHNQSCFGKDGELVCSLEEIEEHIHDPSCFNENGERICGKEEVELHKHSSDCYDENNTLICGKLEVTEHSHSIDCFKMPALELIEEYNGLKITLNADEGVFPVVSSDLTLKICEAPDEIKSVLESRFNGNFAYKIVDIYVTAGDNTVYPSQNITLTIENIDDKIDINSSIVCFVDNSGEEKQIDSAITDESTLSVSTRALGTFVVASPLLNNTVKKSAHLLVPSGDGVSYTDRLTDRSNDIGVLSEGYTDSPYNFEKTYTENANVWTSDQMSEVGGTVFIGRTNHVLIPNHDVKVWQSEQYWDGKKPFRITSA